MRGIVIAIALAAGSAAADDLEAMRAERARYIEESMTVCRERVALVDEWICDDAAVGGAYLWDAEVRGRFTDPRFELDEGGPAALREIARECRLATMDGELIDGLSASLCIVRGVQDRNREVRARQRFE